MSLRDDFSLFELEQKSIRAQAVASPVNTMIKIAADTRIPSLSYMMGAVTPPSRLL